MLNSPTYTTPILYMDLNDGLGIEGGIPTASTAVGEEGRCSQSIAGTLVDSWMQVGSMAAYNTFYPAGPTHWHHSAPPTRLDYIAGPIMLLQAIKRYYVDRRAGRRLQIITDNNLRDHMPLKIIFSAATIQHKTQEPKKQQFPDFSLVPPCFDFGPGLSRYLYVRCQNTHFGHRACKYLDNPGPRSRHGGTKERSGNRWFFDSLVLGPVSYTHLTLPTKA